MSYTIRVVLDGSCVERYVHSVTPLVISRDLDPLPFPTKACAIAFAGTARDVYHKACVHVFDSNGEGSPVNEDDGE